MEFDEIESSQIEENFSGENELDLAEESKQKIALSLRQLEILDRIYQNIDTFEFNTDIQLDDFDVLNLKDFWVYTSGFLAVQNFEKSLSEDLAQKESESQEILDGHFVLKQLTSDEAKNMLETYKVKLQKNQSQNEITLCTIQDGTYKIEKHKINGEVVRLLTLSTDPISYTSNADHELSSFETLKAVRNRLVHSVPYIMHSTLTFIGNKFDDELVVSKMWLRGFSEMFSQMGNFSKPTVSFNDVYEYLSVRLKAFRNSIEDKRDVPSLITLLKQRYGNDINPNLEKLIETHISCFPNFNFKPFDKRVEIVSKFVADNIYSKDKYQTINFNILYNLQQLIAKTVTEKTPEYGLEFFNDTDYDFSNEKKEIAKRIKEIVYELKGPNLSSKNKALLLYQKTQLENLNKRILQTEKILLDQLKYETMNMNLIDLNGLKHAPVDIAFNTMCLYAYNALITSGFYEEVLSELPHNKIFTDEYKAHRDLISSISVASGIHYRESVKNSKIQHIENVRDKTYVLTLIRHALCHGNVSYTISKNNYNPSFRDVVVKFYSDNANTSIIGTLEEFIMLFSEQGFFTLRNDILGNNNSSTKPEGQPGDNEN
ncbi:MAG: hypothetical protein IJ538_03045 [Clostridia bacterium]|nr:hypothetical protein [Clostridia bacterium]